MTRDEIMAREQADQEQNARVEKQMKQCAKCYYCAHVNGTLQKYCDFLSWEGHLRDKGEGPGKCGSFKHRKKLTKEKQVERLQKALKRGEAETIDKRFRHEDN